MRVVAADRHVGYALGLDMSISGARFAESVARSLDIWTCADRPLHESIQRECAWRGIERSFRAKHLALPALAHEYRHLPQGLLKIGARGRKLLARLQLIHARAQNRAFTDGAPALLVDICLQQFLGLIQMFLLALQHEKVFKSVDKNLRGLRSKITQKVTQLSGRNQLSFSGDIPARSDFIGELD